MPETYEPDYGLDLAIIHSVITRAIDVTLEKGENFLRDGYNDDVTKKGFVDYTHCLGSFINGHHISEDDIVFPYLKDKMPDARFDLLTVEHRQLSSLLINFHVANLGIASGCDTRENLDKLIETAEKILIIWRPHIEVEEAYLSTERMNKITSVEEQMALNKLSSEHSQKNSEPANLLVPFVLYDLQPEARARFSRALPSEIKDQMVPIIWKESWEAMRPFLLE